MANSDPRQPGAGAAAFELLEDWITIWHSEMAALLLDRESQDTALRLLDIWAAQARGALALMASPGDDGGRDGSGRSAGSDATAGAAAAAAASDGRDALIARLSGQLTELEQRLAQLEPSG